MAVRRTGIGAPASFFSFQDIMMCCLGIMVLLSATIVLRLKPALDAGAAVSASAAEATPQQVASRAQQVQVLESEIRAGHALQNRDLDAEIAALQHEWMQSESEVQEAIARLHRLFDGVRQKRDGDKADPSVVTAAVLLEQRDQLARQLAESESRRKLTFLDRDQAARPTLILEVSSFRIVAAMAVGDGSTTMRLIDGPDAGAGVLKTLIADALQRNWAVLIALKPSGRSVYEKWADAKDQELVQRRVGLELIGEDRWISDAHPVLKGGANGG